MLCQKCGERQATFHYQQNVNGQKTEWYLCEHCRKEIGMDSFAGNSLNWNDFFGVFDSPLSLFGSSTSGLVADKSGVKKRNALVCEQCGMRFEDFRNGGNLGCSHCYETFKDRLDGVLKRLHGSNRHKGRLPEFAEEEVEQVEQLTDENIESVEEEESTTHNADNISEKVAYQETDIADLKAKIKEAVTNEEYEEAARLRDIIRRIEAGESV